MPLLRRLLSSVGVLLFASFLSFILIKLAPGDLAQSIAQLRTGAVGSPKLLAQIRLEYGLNDPFIVQYGRWLIDALQGNLGRSIQTNIPIAQDVSARAGMTFALAGGALLFGAVTGIGLALAGALRPGGTLDRILRYVGLFAVSIPGFALALILILLFALKLRWLPVTGTGTLSGWILPWIALGLASAGTIARVLRSSLADAMNQTFVTTALSRGYTMRQVVFREAFPSVLTGLFAVLGVQFGQLFISTVVIEAIFGITGLGQYFFHAAQFRDLPVVQSSLFLFALVFVGQSLIVDFLQRLVDPRVRRGSSTA
ncbi:MAG: ABC transporter permease [Actinomycetota bacterium]